LLIGAGYALKTAIVSRRIVANISPIASEFARSKGLPHRHVCAWLINYVNERLGDSRKGPLGTGQDQEDLIFVPISIAKLGLLDGAREINRTDHTCPSSALNGVAGLPDGERSARIQFGCPGAIAGTSQSALD
jgi:hypothetical protein